MAQKADFSFKMKKNKLVIDYDFDFDLLGVTSSAKGYKLAWEVNKHLGIHLVKQPDLVVGFKNKEEKTFLYYSFETPLNRLKLLKNRPIDTDQGKYYLVPEYPHFDFIILARFNESRMHETLSDTLKQIPFVELIAPIPLEGLKSKSNFVF
jgi:hypothetical protein